MPSKVSGVLRGYWGSIREALDGSERCLRGLIGVLKEPWAFQLPQRCLKGTVFLEVAGRCLGGVSEVS